MNNKLFTTGSIAVVLSALSVVVLAAGGAAGEQSPYADSVDEHFHAKGKPPSEHTLAVIKAARESMPFEDTRDFDEAKKGFIAPLKSKIIKADAGHVAWDVERYEFLAEDREFDSVHPSTKRQGWLNQITGLYKVADGIYQVRGLDLANITFVRGKEGWIVFDPLTSLEPARAGLELINEKIERLPVTAVIYSHSHGDHFGGVRGVVDPERYAAGKVEIIAPRDFMEHAVSENVYAGNAMNRRLFFQYGVLLPASPFGHAGQGLMQNVSSGNFGLLQPTLVVEPGIKEIEVDGIKMVFQNTPGTEAPSEMNTYFPEKKALWMAENVSNVIHNIYTLRGAQVRNALAWSKYIARAMFLFDDAEVMFASHSWPRWGKARINEVLAGQRDAYAHLNNQTLHYANQGVTINQIHNVYRVPKSLDNAWYARGYHGSPQHNSRGVIQRFLGFWDANPTTLIPLSPEDSAPLYVEMMGGAEPIMQKGRELAEQGNYRLAQEILDKLVWAQPDNQEAKDLLADVWEQIGYQQENPGLRNSFLAGALELRSGIPQGASPDSGGPDMISAMSTELFLDFIGIRMDSKKAEALGDYKINLVTPDNGEKFAINLSNATFTNVQGFVHDDPDLAITINRSDLENVMMGVKSFAASIEDGTAKAEGDPGILAKVASTLVTFQIGFEVLPGTAAPVKEAGLNPYAVAEDSVFVSGE
jgi:alkyl sulfatase BDS1-like metallo-beta-lactamase superfamily hydrolase